MGGGSSSGSQSSSISYTGSPYFDKLLQVMAKDYGTNRATSDLIFGGPRYGNARNFLDQRFAAPEGLTQDQWAQQLRSLGSAEARQLATAATQNKTRDRNIYKSVKDGETTLWAFDPGQNIYVGWGIRKNSDGTSSKYRAGAWAPSLGTQAPWLAAPAPDEPPPPNPPGPPPPPAPQPNPGGTEPDTGGGSSGGGPGGGPGFGGSGSGSSGGSGGGGMGGGTAPPRGGPPTSAGTGARRPPFGGAGWEQSWGSFDPNDPAPKPTSVDRSPSRQDDEYLDFFRRLMQGGA